MKIEEFIQASRTAIENKAENARTNFDEIIRFFNENVSTEDGSRLLGDFYQVGLLIKSVTDDDYTHAGIMMSQCILRNKETILKLMNCPEMEIEFI